MRCLECKWGFEAPGGISGQQIPRCPLCSVAAERDATRTNLDIALEALELLEQVDFPYAVNVARRALTRIRGTRPDDSEFDSAKARSCTTVGKEE